MASRQPIQFRTGDLFWAMSLATLFVATASVASCSRSPSPSPSASIYPKPSGARLEVAEAIDIAKRAAAAKGKKLSDYELREFKFERESRSWHVYFVGFVPAPGNHFSIAVDEATGRTRFLGGK